MKFILVKSPLSVKNEIYSIFAGTIRLSYGKHIFMIRGMDMLKKLALVFILVLLSLSFISCSNQNKSYDNIQASKTNEDKLTVDEIKANYEDGENGQWVDVTTYNQYVLVEYINSADLQGFDWYNLKTGDKDTLPVQPYHVKLERIQNENNIWFISDGVMTLNGHKYFPERIECHRGQEITGFDGDFSQTLHSIYLKIDQEFDMGVKANEAISDIKVSLKGVEVLFEPIPGEEAMFHAAYTTVPPTKTSYDKTKNQFIVEFKNTDINKAYVEYEINEQNRYISSVDVRKDGSNTILSINLKDTANYYTIDFSHLEPVIDDFPYLDFNFASEYRME